METAILIGIVFWGIVFGAFCAFLAKQKNRDTGAWFLLGLLFSLIALIAIAASPVRQKESKIEAIAYEQPLPPSKGEKIFLKVALVVGFLLLMLAIVINILRR